MATFPSIDLWLRFGQIFQPGSFTIQGKKPLGSGISEPRDNLHAVIISIHWRLDKERLNNKTGLLKFHRVSFNPAPSAVLRAASPWDGAVIYP